MCHPVFEPNQTPRGITARRLELHHKASHAALIVTTNPASSASQCTCVSTRGAANRSAKPSIADFMRATDTDFHTASSTLYGVIGSNQDLRDWNAIMAVDDPLLAARQATGALYASGYVLGAADEVPHLFVEF